MHLDDVLTELVAHSGDRLLFSYPEGPPVSVSITSGCHPEIDNPDLQSNSASSILPVIQQLLKPK
jgi:hypothetical protein